MLFPSYCAILSLSLTVMNDCCVSNLITLEMDNYSVNPFFY